MHQNNLNLSNLTNDLHVTEIESRSTFSFKELISSLIREMTRTHSLAVHPTNESDPSGLLDQTFNVVKFLDTMKYLSSTFNQVFQMSKALGKNSH